MSDLTVVEGSVEWTGQRLRSMAWDARERIRKTKSETIIVCSSSAPFVATAVLAAWSESRAPLILDPSLEGERNRIHERYPGAPALVSALTPGLRNAVVVPESKAGSIDIGPPADDNIAASFFTSGSTGEPKIITKLGYQLSRQTRAVLPALGVPSGPKVFSLVPPVHILGFMYGLFVPITLEGTACFPGTTVPEAWIECIRDGAFDYVIGVPSHYRFIVNSLDGPLPEGTYLSSGAPLSAKLDTAFRERAGRTITQVFGSTETGGIAQRQGRDPWRPFPEVSWRVREEDDRLLISSPWQEGSEKWFVTDDVAVREGKGFRLVGRADSIVKVGGKRFSSSEVEREALALPVVDQAVAVTWKRYDENALALFVTLKEGCTLTQRRLWELVAGRLPRFKMARTVRIVRSFPYLSNGKVDKQRLRAELQSEGD
jgi:acyl-coenzyme A synthetase/AMP-(fatty) acid ligase